MIIKDPKLLKEFRQAGPCECCGRACLRREAAHVFAKGMGGGSQLDVRQNLVGLHPDCHRRSHDGGKPTQKRLIEIVAEREGATPEEITEWVYLLRRTKR